MDNNYISQLSEKIDFNSEELELRKEFFGLNNKDIQSLKLLHEYISLLPDVFISDFYTRLRSFPELDEILTDDAIGKIMVSQSEYFHQLTSGHYDLDYVANRLKLGVIHNKNGVKPKWFIGAYADYLSGILDLAFNNELSEEHLDLNAIRALFRIVLFDISLGLESYFLPDKRSSTQLKDFNESIISGIPVGIVVVDNNLIIKKSNTRFRDLFEVDVIPDDGLLNNYIDTNEISEAIEASRTKKDKRGTVRVNAKINGRLHYLKIDVSLQYVDDEKFAIIAIDDQKITSDLQESQLLSRQIIDGILDVIITIDQKGVISSSNKSVKKLFGYKEEEIIGCDINKLIPGISDLDEIKNIYQKSVINQGFINNKKEIVLKGCRKEGGIFPVGVTLTEIVADSGNKLIIVVKDMSEISDSRDRANELSRVVEQTADFVMVTDEKGVINYVNPSFEKITGHAYSDVVGKTPSMLKSGRHDQEFYRQLWETINRGDVFNDVFINRKSNGDVYYEEKTITPLKDENNNIIRFVSTGKDVTERIQAQEHLYHLANHDALTDLPNRSLLSERIKQAISRARWHDRMVALLFLDLDQFKMINDTLGHDIGDEIIIEVAGRLKECIRDGDTVSRLGGDEFAILLADIANIDDVDPLAEKILDKLSASYNIQDRELYITASIGISCFPADGDKSKILLKNADVAMYRAKDNGRNNFEYFSDEMTARAFKRLNLETRLRNALKNNEFKLFYQPQVDSESGKIGGVEALLRWHCPDNGIVSPIDFIPILEDTGLIIPVGQWVIRTACELMKSLDKFGVYLNNMSINFSARQISDQQIIPLIKECLRDAELASDRITIEITESLLMKNRQNSISLLGQFRDIGLKIALDDFGTGYSSLSYLTKFPINIVKIDRSFITDVPDNNQNSSLTSAIISMTHDLGLTVVAEGVENIGQVEFLRERNCDVYQGFYFSKPIDASELKYILSKEQDLLRD